MEREKKKEEEKKQKEELAALFKPVAQTVAKGKFKKKIKNLIEKIILIILFLFEGVDPKSVVCVYFKQGLCQKGDRCSSKNLIFYL